MGKDIKLVFYALEDKSLFEQIHTLLLPELNKAGLPILPAPRSRRLTDDNGTAFCILQFSMEANFVDPYAYFIYSPTTLESAIVIREANRRSYYRITESVLDVFLAHTNLFGFHGSSISYKQKGIIIAGSVGVGKTSLILALIRSGAQFLSDDISIIASGQSLLPLEQKRLTLRSHIVDYLARHGLMFETRWLSQSDESAPEMYSYISEIFDHSVYGEPVQLRAIVLPKFMPELTSTQLTPLDHSESIPAIRKVMLPWIMQWEVAYELYDKRAKVESSLNDLIQTGNTIVLRMNYGSDLDVTAKDLTLYLDSFPGW